MTKCKVTLNGAAIICHMTDAEITGSVKEAHKRGTTLNIETIWAKDQHHVGEIIEFEEMIIRHNTKAILEKMKNENICGP